MLIYAIDPGALHFGWSLQRKLQGEFHLIDSGTDGLTRPEGQSYGDYKWALMRYWWETFPDFLAYCQSERLPGEDFRIVSETLPPNVSNGAAASQINLARVAVTVCQIHALLDGIEWVEKGANSIKLMVAGDGKATKTRVTNGIIAVYPELEERGKELKSTAKDESDAIAVGLAELGHQVPKKKKK